MPKSKRQRVHYKKFTLCTANKYKRHAKPNRRPFGAACLVGMWLHGQKNAPPGPQNAALFFFQKFIGGFRIICSAFPSYLNQQHLKVAFQQ